jgi:hypothetical protein
MHGIILGPTDDHLEKSFDSCSGPSPTVWIVVVKSIRTRGIDWSQIGAYHKTENNADYSVLHRLDSIVLPALPVLLHRNELKSSLCLFRNLPARGGCLGYQASNAYRYTLTTFSLYLPENEGHSTASAVVYRCELRASIEFGMQSFMYLHTQLHGQCIDIIMYVVELL